jgi:hypothetical protein
VIYRFTRQILKGYDCKAAKVSGRDIVRVQPFVASVENGRYYLIRAPWNKKFLREFEDFPGGAHTDQIIAAAGGHDILEGNKVNAGAFGRRGKKPPTKARGADAGTTEAEGSAIDPRHAPPPNANQDPALQGVQRMHYVRLGLPLPTEQEMMPRPSATFGRKARSSVPRYTPVDYHRREA